MNELIEKLAKQAFGSTIDTDPILVYEAEKFAELIVKECMDICMKEVDTGLLMAPQAPWIAKQIKQHFGVEE